jgi:hypothetical protein
MGGDVKTPAKVDGAAVEAYLMLLWCVVCEVSWWMSVRGRGRVELL